MALNPAFASASTRRLPLAFGYILGSGDQVLSTVAQDGSQFGLWILGEGEWDGVELFNTFADNTASPPVPSHIHKPTSEINSVLHFHSGAYSVKGAGAQTTSVGPDQGYDVWFPQFPSPTPPQCLSGVAYVIVGAPGPPGFSRGTYFAPTISAMAVWRTTRCRTFDTYGNVVAYGFTCNPVWHRVEAILRYKIKVQQPANAGLTEAERACFNWPSIVETAARNDFILPNGNPRFVGNYIFAADATLASILELSERCDRSYHRVDGGQIYMIGNDSRASVFLASARHLVPGTLHLDKKDVSKAANIFVPRYRDLQMPAVVQALDAQQFPQFISGGSSYSGYISISGTTPSPFATFAYATYGGAADASFDGEYQVCTPGGYPYPYAPGLPDDTFSYIPGPGRAATTTGGYLGSQDSRFSSRAPIGVQHRSAQQIVAAQAPGVAVQPRLAPVFYDCGNSTFDQTNRLMKFERDRSLGTDVGGTINGPWTAPRHGTLTLYYECVDANGKRLCDVRVHDVISLDDWLYPEGAGDYEVMELAIEPPSDTALGSIELTLMQYNPNAATDVSDPVGDYYQSVPNTDLSYALRLAVRNWWVIQATPYGVLASDGTLTVTIPDLTVQVLGIAGYTRYPNFTVAEVPSAAQCYLVVQDTSGTGVGATYSVVAGPSPAAGAAGEMWVLSGSFQLPAGTAVGAPPVALFYSPLFTQGT